MKGEKRVTADEVSKCMLKLLSTGADDEEIMEGMVGIDLDISTVDIQQIRIRLSRKRAADKEMLESSEEVENAPPVSYQEIVDINGRWSRIMQRFESRRDFALGEMAWIANVKLDEHSSRSKL